MSNNYFPIVFQDVVSTTITKLADQLFVGKPMKVNTTRDPESLLNCSLCIIHLKFLTLNNSVAN